MNWAQKRYGKSVKFTDAYFYSIRRNMRSEGNVMLKTSEEKLPVNLPQNVDMQGVMASDLAGLAEIVRRYGGISKIKSQLEVLERMQVG